jgi:hexosaminidase
MKISIGVAIKRILWGVMACFMGWGLADAQCPIIPQPAVYAPESGTLDLRQIRGVMATEARFAPVAGYLQRELLTYQGLTIPRYRDSLPQAGMIVLDTDPKLAEEAYRLRITPHSIRITAGQPHGAFNGVISLLQLARLSTTGQLKCARIEDHPSMHWRGIMLDESRHFFGVETVKMLLDWMAFYKLDRFHWHLTDVQGWRIQIQKYPKLALIGGVGNNSDSLAPARYYTQQQIQEIVQYARERYIEIIPEIDMPGHASAANRAYPQFSGGGSPQFPDFTFNPGKDSTYGYLTGILKEVNVLFPAGLLHIGGDEVSYGNAGWKADPAVGTLMQRENLPDLTAVERYFVQRMADSVIEMGSDILGWDEIAQADVPPEKAIIFWWRHDRPATLKLSLDKGYRVVLCPRIPLYFDFVQTARDSSGRRWDGNFCTEQQIYAYSPQQYAGIVNAGNKDLILGIQANLWTEKVSSTARLEYLFFPRMAALAEAAWTPESDRKDYAGFQQRIAQQNTLYRKQKLKYFDLLHPALTPEIIDEYLSR